MMFGSKKQELIIEGMMCEHCAAHVKEALEKLEGVKGVKVDLAAKTAFLKVGAELPENVLREAVEKAGYRLKEIR